MPKIKITIDKTKCTSSASCVVIAPENFDLGEDGKSMALHEVVTENLEQVKKAAAACPVGAIILEELAS